MIDDTLHTLLTAHAATCDDVGPILLAADRMDELNWPGSALTRMYAEAILRSKDLVPDVPRGWKCNSHLVSESIAKTLPNLQLRAMLLFLAIRRCQVSRRNWPHDSLWSMLTPEVQCDLLLAEGQTACGLYRPDDVLSALFRSWGIERKNDLQTPTGVATSAILTGCRVVAGRHNDKQMLNTIGNFSSAVVGLVDDHASRTTYGYCWFLDAATLLRELAVDYKVR